MTGQMEIREYFHETGEPMGRVELLDGVPHGLEQVWQVPGQLTLLAHHRHGQLHGTYQSWWNNGAKKEVGVYENGRKTGMYYWYTPKGDLWAEHNFG